MNNICVVTVDSLRFDVARAAWTPNIEKLARKRWQRVYSHGTNTLPAHTALFQGGQIPSTTNGGRYDCRTMRFFKPKLDWDKDRDAVYVVPEAANIVKGFEKRGFRTVGIGGVHWFDSRFETSGSIWKNYFDEFYWEPEFAEEHKNSFSVQLAMAERLKLRQWSEWLFLFINIADTHVPFHRGDSGFMGQIKEMEYVDQQFARLVELMPRPCHFLIFGDHGHCFGDRDGIDGHGFCHTKVLEVPIVDFVLE